MKKIMVMLFGLMFIAADCGYKVYHSSDGGVFAQVGSDVSAGTELFTHPDVPMGINCYKLTAFNQYGESAFSVEACAADINVPPAPDGTSITINISITVSP